MYAMQFIPLSHFFGIFPGNAEECRRKSA